MVVTRRQSASPMPAVPSRTSSSTGSRSSNKGKGIDKSSPLKEAAAGPSHVPPNGISLKPPQVGPRRVEDIKFEDDPPFIPPKSTPTKSPTKSKSKAKAKKPAKSKKHHANKGISAFDILARLFLLWLTIYTLSVCPEDTELRSPVCRALTEYRRVILEPYIYPPICAALDHPAVAPHIERVQPYYNHAVQISTPWVRRGKHEWRRRVVPQIQWLQLRARPYVLRAEGQYNVTVRPYVQQVSKTAAQYRLQVEPYILAAALKSHHSWDIAKPYLLPLWREVKRVPGILAVYVGGPLGDARRQWVDPQVIKIWDAVVEKGKADTQVYTASTKVTSFASASSTPVSSISSTPGAKSTDSIEDVTRTDTVTAAAPPIPEPTDEAAASASSIIVESASVISSTPDSSVAQSSPLLASASSISSSSQSSTTSTVIPEPSSAPESFATPSVPDQTDAAAASAASVIYESEGLRSSSAGKETPIQSDRATSESNTEKDLDDIDDLDTFLSDLDVDTTPKVEEPPPVQEETQEEREERLRLQEIESAEKRADIEARHTQWEIDLEKFGKSQRKVVRTTLKRLRDAASEEARTPGGPVRAPIEALVQEAEKSLKSLKAYARKLAGEDKSEAEKIKAWETVVDKVDKKFGERVDSSADVVRTWWDAHNQQEVLEISRIAGQVEYVADRAQEDLGLDYTWLKGVTYHDWQRYHRLMLTSKDFAAVFIGMQNGTTPNAPANPVSEVMEAIQEEVDDMILGFETNLGRLKSAAIDSFSSTKSDTPSVSAAQNVPSGAVEGSVKAPAAPVTTSASESVPEVSILPIEPSGAKPKVDVPPVILSRGAEEVQSAVSMAEEAKTKAVHTEL